MNAVLKVMSGVTMVGLLWILGVLITNPPRIDFEHDGFVVQVTTLAVPMLLVAWGYSLGRRNDIAAIRITFLLAGIITLAAWYWTATSYDRAVSRSARSQSAYQVQVVLSASEVGTDQSFVRFRRELRHQMLRDSLELEIAAAHASPEEMVGFTVHSFDIGFLAFVTLWTSIGVFAPRRWWGKLRFRHAGA